MEHVHRDAVRLLTDWQPNDAAQRDLRDQYLEFLEAHRDAVMRECRIGHLTASAMVVNPARDAVLLTLHPKVERWLQLGGHIEASDGSIQEAAIRETWEESGHRPQSISHMPVRLDRHVVPCGGSVTEHWDVQFIATLSADADPRRSDESLALAWFPIDAVPGDDSVQALVSAARAADDTQVWIR